MKHKSYLDARVAHELGMYSDKKLRLVSAITTEFVRQVRILLVERGLIGVDGLGRFCVKWTDQKRKAKFVDGTGKPGGRRGTRTVDYSKSVRIHFKKSAALKKLLEESNHV